MWTETMDDRIADLFSKAINPIQLVCDKISAQQAHTTHHPFGQSTCCYIKRSFSNITRVRFYQEQKNWIEADHLFQTISKTAAYMTVAQN